MKDHIRRHLSESVVVKQSAIAACSDAIVQAVQLIIDSFRAGGKLLICGNGGSAADSQHFAAEFVSRLTKDFDRPALPAIALTTNTSVLTAYANDVSFEGIFARQVEALGKPGDVLFGISTSGNSGNVIRAIETARAAHLRSIALLGQGGQLAILADVVIAVPSRDTQYIQETHLAIEHIVCALVEQELFSQKQSEPPGSA